MSIIDRTKDIADLIKKLNDIDLYRKVELGIPAPIAIRMLMYSIKPKEKLWQLIWHCRPNRLLLSRQ